MCFYQFTDILINFFLIIDSNLFDESPDSETLFFMFVYDKTRTCHGSVLY